MAPIPTKVPTPETNRTFLLLKNEKVPDIILVLKNCNPSSMNLNLNGLNVKCQLVIKQAGAFA